jgi:hypothetical protein
VSGELEGAEYDLHGVTNEQAPLVGVPHERELIALAEAVVRGDEAELAEARRASLAALGPESFVAAAAVASNFERMERIADATGTADAPLVRLGGMRAEWASTPHPPRTRRSAARPAGRARPRSRAT